MVLRCHMHTLPYCRSEVLAKQLLLQYYPGVMSLPTVVMVNHASGAVHRYIERLVTKERLVSWLQAVVDEMLPPSGESSQLAVSRRGQLAAGRRRRDASAQW